MPSKERNLWYRGIGRDDYIQQEGEILEGVNIDGIHTGYGVTIGPKITKKFTTSTSVPINVFEYTSSNTVFLNRSLVFCNDGNVYTMDDADDTPSYTFTAGRVPLAGFFQGGYIYIIHGDSNIFTPGSVPNFHLAQVTTADVVNGTWASMNESFNISFGSHYDIPPVLKIGSLVYVGVSGGMQEVNSSGTATSRSLISGFTTGITAHGTTLYLYTSNKEVDFYHTASNTISQKQLLGFFPQRATQIGGIDYVTSKEGGLYAIGGEQSGNITYKRLSNRGSDNSSYATLFDFSIGEYNGETSTVSEDDVYVVNNATQTSLVKYGSLFSGMPNGIHNILNRNNAGTLVDEIYWVKKFTNSDILYFGYKAGSVYGVDYIDVSSFNTYTDGNLITGIFRGPPDKRCAMQEIKYTTSNTSGSNYIKIYTRIDNGAWSTGSDIITVNNSSDTIKRDRKTRAREFVDIQFKIEFHNNSGGDTPPILHHFELVYKIINE